MCKRRAFALPAPPGKLPLAANVGDMHIVEQEILLEGFDGARETRSRSTKGQLETGEVTQNVRCRGKSYACST